MIQFASFIVALGSIVSVVDRPEPPIIQDIESKFRGEYERRSSYPQSFDLTIRTQRLTHDWVDRKPTNPAEPRQPMMAACQDLNEIRRLRESLSLKPLPGFKCEPYFSVLRIRVMPQRIVVASQYSRISFEDAEQQPRHIIAFGIEGYPDYAITTSLAPVEPNDKRRYTVNFLSPSKAYIPAKNWNPQFYGLDLDGNQFMSKLPNPWTFLERLKKRVQQDNEKSMVSLQAKAVSLIDAKSYSLDLAYTQREQRFKTEMVLDFTLDHLPKGYRQVSYVDEKLFGMEQNLVEYQMFGAWTYPKLFAKARVGVSGVIQIAEHDIEIHRMGDLTESDFTLASLNLIDGQRLALPGRTPEHYPMWNRGQIDETQTQAIELARWQQQADILDKQAALYPDQRGEGGWQGWWISVILGVLGLLFLGLWWRARRSAG